MEALLNDQRGNIGKELVVCLWKAFETIEDPTSDSRSLISLGIRNDSDGHGGTRGGETHFAVALCSEAFDSEPKLRLPLARHRAVLEAAKPLLAAKGGIHALSIHTVRPSKVVRAARAAIDDCKSSASPSSPQPVDLLWEDPIAVLAARDAAGLKDVPPCAGSGDGSAKAKFKAQLDGRAADTEAETGR